jgi:hypothetical protein
VNVCVSPIKREVVEGITEMVVNTGAGVGWSLGSPGKVSAVISAMLEYPSPSESSGSILEKAKAGLLECTDSLWNAAPYRFRGPPPAGLTWQIPQVSSLVPLVPYFALNSPL